MIGLQWHPVQKIDQKQCEGSKTTLDVYSNDIAFTKVATDCDSFFVWAEKLDQNLIVLHRHWNDIFT